MSAPQERITAGLIAALAAFLLLWNLGAPILWEDEAETALLARNTLLFGWPRATGGPSGVISQQCGADYEASTGRWIRHPWGPFYLTAGSFALLNESAFAARLPHALLALACVPATWLLARRFGLTGRSVALLPWLLVLSSPFLLYARQCRYHAMAMLGATIAVAALPGLRGPRWKRDSLLLAMGLLLLIEASYLLFFAVAFGLALAGPVLLHPSVARKRLALVLAAVALGSLPLLWLQGFFSGAVAHAATLGPPLPKLWGYLLKLDLFFLPLPVMLLGLVVAALRPKDRAPRLPERTRIAAFLAVFVLANLIALSFSTIAFSRYLSHLLPVFSLALALALLAIRRIAPLAAWVFALATVGTHFLHGWLAAAFPVPSLRPDEAFPSPLVETLVRIGAPPPGPLGRAVEFLDRHANPHDVALITFGDLPLRFHTRLRIVGGESGEDLRGLPPPDWVVWRPFFRMRPRTPATEEDQKRMRAFLAALPWNEYERVAFSPRDTVWSNNPEPELRLHRWPPDAPRLAIYRRVKAVP